MTLLPLHVDKLHYAVGGATLLHDLSFALEPGPLTVLLGPNGAGKSLTLRLCHGLLTPTSGTIRWNEAPQSKQAMVFQRPVLLRRSARANVEYALALAGVSRPTRRTRAADAIERVGLTTLSRQAAPTLSSGEQQRLALARAWACEPEVLFLDEPTANLDPAAAHAVESILRAIHASGTKIVMTTHDLGQARRLADDVLFLHQGRLVERAESSAFFDSPQNNEAAAFVRGELHW